MTTPGGEPDDTPAHSGDHTAGGRQLGVGPMGGQMFEVLGGLAERFQLKSLEKRHSSTMVLGFFAFINGVISIALMSVAALITGAPFIFPSLGPTAFLFFYTPTAPSASPKNAICGHAIGCVAGWIPLWALGLLNAGPATAPGHGVTWARVAAAALSLGFTSGLMVWFKVPHPPAGATTLIISLGILPHLWQLGVLMIAVVFLTIQAFVINRAAGIPYPLWSPRPQVAGTG